MSAPRVANAPLSYGAFEITVGSGCTVPDPQAVLGAIANAGYAGTDLGPVGYFGEGQQLCERLQINGLDLVGGFVSSRFSEPEHWEQDLVGLHATLDMLIAAGAADARPVLCDAGGRERLANPGRGGDEPSLRLDARRWAVLIDGINRAAAASRERGFDPVFHHHTSSYVEALPEIERFLEDTDIDLLLDSGHLAVAGVDPIRALRAWRDRIGIVHMKDTRLDILREIRAEHADMVSAWRRGVFCALGHGDVDLEGFCVELARGDYDGWIVIEQDRVLEDPDAFDGAVAEQHANREWLREHTGW